MVMFRTILSTSISLGLLSIRLIISAWHKPNQYSKPLSAASSRTIPCAAAAAKSSRSPWFSGCEVAVDWPWLRTRTALRPDAHPAGNPFDGIAGRGIGAGDQHLKLQPDFGCNGLGKAPLVGKMVEKTAFADSGMRNDVVDRDRVDGAVHEQIETSGDQGGTGSLDAGRRRWMACHVQRLVDYPVKFKSSD